MLFPWLLTGHFHFISEQFWRIKARSRPTIVVQQFLFLSNVWAVKKMLYIFFIIFRFFPLLQKESTTTAAATLVISLYFPHHNFV
jgi:uncharacterized membrane protein